MIRRTVIWFAAVFLLFVALPPAVRAEVRVVAELQPNVVETGEAASLVVSVEGAVRIDSAPDVPVPRGLRVESRGQSTNVQIVNGRMSRSISFTFVIYAMAPGKYTLGPVQVREGGKVYQSESLSFEVTRGAPPGSPGAAGTPGTRGSSGAGSPAGPAGLNPGESFGDGALFVRALVDKERAVLGEQVTLRFQFYKRTGVPLLDQPQYSPPETPGFWREDLPPQRTFNKTIEGVPYEVTELVYALFPTQVGRLDVGSASLTCAVQVRSRRRAADPFSIFGDIFGEERRVQLETRALKVQVDALPTPTPANFTGGVGRYELSASLDRSEAPQNEPITLSAVIRGSGNVANVGEPKVEDVVGFRLFPPTSETKSATDGDRGTGEKTIQYVFIPEATGPQTIPELTLSVYNPELKRYQELRAGPFPVRITPGSAGSAGGPAGVARVGRDLRTIRAATSLRASSHLEPWADPRFWAAQSVPLLLLGGAFLWRRRRDKDLNDWSGFLHRRAPSRFRAQLDALATADAASGFASLGAALEAYITERFGFPARGRTRSELRSALHDHGVDAGAIDRVCALFDSCDLARFAPQAIGADALHAALVQARQVADAFDRVARTKRRNAGAQTSGAAPRALLFLACFGSSFAAAVGLAGSPAFAKPDATAAESAFQAGNAAYQAGNFAEAARQYQAVADLGFDSADLWLNLGNSEYKIGRLGWAVYAFERGLALAPNDPDLKANLEVARAETKDRLPDLATQPLLAALGRIQDRLPLGRALVWAAVAWWAFVLWLCARIVLRPNGGAFGTVGAVLGIALLSWVAFAGIQALREARRPNAVVVADELPVRSNPDALATVEFSLHAGTTLRLGRSTPGFCEVLFSERLRGWADEAGVARLRAARAR